MINPFPNEVIPADADLWKDAKITKEECLLLEMYNTVHNKQYPPFQQHKFRTESKCKNTKDFCCNPEHVEIDKIAADIE